MGPERMPLSKLLDTPFISLDETNVEMLSILFLFVAVAMVTGIRRHRQLWRHAMQITSAVVFFYLIYSCLGVFGMIRNGLYGVTLIGTAYSESFYWLALPVVILASTVLTGPIFCGWICPTGSIQELAAWLNRKILGSRSKSKLNLALLGLFASGFFALVVWLSLRQKLFIEDSSLHWGGSLLLLCYLVLVGFIDDVPTRSLRAVSLLAIVVTAASHLTITSPVHFAFTARDDPASMITTLVICVAGLIVSRSWCRYVCPFGYLLGFVHRHSRVKLRILESHCVRCGTCQSNCDVGAIDTIGIRHAHCQMCFSCVDGCPHGAIEVVDVWRDHPETDPVRACFVATARPQGK